MNIELETQATLYLAAAFASWLVFTACAWSVAFFIRNRSILWMRRTGKPYSSEVWFDRCLLIYCFLTLFFTSGFDFLTKFLAAGVVLHLAVENPWMIRHVERVRKQDMKGRK